MIAPLTMDRLEQSRAIAGLDPWEHHGAPRRDHCCTGSPRTRAGAAGARAVFRWRSIATARKARRTCWSELAAAVRSCIQLQSAAHARRCSPELAVLTGGRSFLLRDIKDLEKTLADIARELR